MAGTSPVDLAIQGFSIEAQDASGRGLIPADSVQDMLNVSPFDFFQRK
jgi:hypothetical protein